MNLLNIIKKDFFAYKRSMYFLIFYLIFFPLMFQNQNIFTMISVLCVYLVTGTSLAYDDKFNFDSIIGILPIKRKTIILGKLVVSNIIFIIVILYFYLLNFIVGILNIPISIDLLYFPMPVKIATSFISVSVVLLSILPLTYKYGYQKTRILSFLITVFLAMGSTAILAVLGEIFEKSKNAILSNENFFSLTIICLGILIQILTYYLSFKVYVNKDA